MPDGSSFPVPVINGYKPQISIKATASYVRRTFTYEHRKKWSGNTELVYVKSKPEPEPKPEPVLKLAAPIQKPKPKPLKSVKPPERKVAEVKQREIKRLPSSIKAEEADFTKKFPRY
jgi:hypothetical protein